MHTLANALRRAELTATGRTALVCNDTRLTFAELVSRSRRLGSVLADLGTVRGDRVAMLSFNSIPLLELYCAVPAAGRVQVPLNFRWALPELTYALEDSGATVLFTDREPGALADLVERVVRLDTGEYEELLDAADETDFEASISPDDLAGLFYTGGTTGASKGVMLTHRNLVANAYNSQMTWPIEPDDVYQIIAPLFHAAGSTSVLQCIYQGATQVIVPTFDPAAILDQIEAEGVTSSIGVPSMLAAQVEAQLTNPRDVSSLRSYGHGGSPIATEVLRRATRAFPNTEFIQVYGATETAPLVTVFRHEDRFLEQDRGRSCGQPLLGVEVEVRGPDGSAVSAGESGEVTVRGDNVMAGYWNKPEQTAAVLRDGWYSTGDIGRLDEKGYLYLLDRAKDMIISGGENVYCTEVEEAIYTHPAVLEAAVFGIPDERWGEVVHAVVVTRAGIEVTPEEIVAHTREKIAGYKVPRSVELRSQELPKSGPGKVLKRQLRAPFWAEQDTQIH